MRIAALAREGLDADRAQQRRQEERARREEARFKSELKQYRRAFQPDTFSAAFGNTTVVGAPVDATMIGAPVAQTGLDEFGAQGGTDLTVAFNRGNVEPIGNDDTTLQVPLDVSSIPGTPSRSIFDSFSIGDSTLPWGLKTPSGEPVELDDRDTSPDA